MGIFLVRGSARTYGHPPAAWQSSTRMFGCTTFGMHTRLGYSPVEPTLKWSRNVLDTAASSRPRSTSTASQKRTTQQSMPSPRSAAGAATEVELLRSDHGAAWRRDRDGR